MTDTAPQRRREGAWAKIIRAEEHLAAIKAEIALYAESDPYKLVGEFNDEGTQYRARLEVREATSIRLQLLIGDFAHNLRSALDHLASWLVVQNSLAPTRQTGFPICVRKPTSLKVDPGISDEAMAVIESVQPYHQGNRALHDKLAVLNAINQTDKHRHLHLATSLLGSAAVWLEWRDIRMSHVQYVKGRFQHGTEVAVFDMAPVPEHLRRAVQARAKAQAVVSLSEPESLIEKPIDSVLGQLVEYVRDEVVPSVEQAELQRLRL